MNFPFLPERASTYATEVDQLALILTLLTVFFTGLVFVLIIFLSIRYRRGSKYSRANKHHHSIVLELGWSVIPLIMALAVFGRAAIPFAHLFSPPSNAEEIFVVAKRWMWHMEHTNGIRENNELHIVVDRPYKLSIISQDVIHGFYVPEFRVKRDAMPGKTNTVWFQATKIGRYHLYCSEYCGTNHSEMGGWIYVMSPADYTEWLKSGNSNITNAPPETVQEQGHDLYTQLACFNCHTNQDTVRAPSLVGIYGRTRHLVGNKTVTADDDYLHDVIRHPENNVLEGYGSIPTMPAYTEEQITEEQVHNLIVYIKSMGGSTSDGSTSPSGSPATNSTPSVPSARRTISPATPAKPVTAFPTSVNVNTPAPTPAPAGNASAIQGTGRNQ